MKNNPRKENRFCFELLQRIWYSYCCLFINI